MKSILSLALALGLVASTANAASLQVDKTNGDQTNAVYLVGAPDNGTFNTVILSATPNAGNSFSNNDAGFNGFFPRTAGEQFTFINQLLGASTAQGGEGWSMLGTVNTAAELAFSGGPLGGNIDTSAKPGGRLFLCNIQLPPAQWGTVLVTLANATGGTVGTATARVGIVPEPASFGLAGLAMLGFAGFRRRFAS